MSIKTINVSYFFENYEEFPWTLFDMTYPLYGPTHSYVFKAFGCMYGTKLQKYSYLQSEIASRIGRMESQEIPLKDIVSYNNKFEEGFFSSNNQAVVACLRQFPDVHAFMLKKLTRYYFQGLIELPEECFK